MTTAVRLVVICAAMPDLPPKKVNELVKFLFAQSEVLTPQHVVDFFTTFSIRYFPMVLPALERAKLPLAIGRALTADDATVVRFKTLLIGASLAAARGEQSELAALAIETINTLVH
jgi:hypothetical protein